MTSDEAKAHLRRHQQERLDVLRGRLVEYERIGDRDMAELTRDDIRWIEQGS